MDFGDYDAQFIQLRAQRLLRNRVLSPAQGLTADPAPDPEVTAVIPAKNEEGTIVKVVEECRCYAGKVLVIDGRSTDQTCRLAREAGAEVYQDDGRGKGSALRAALAHVETGIVVFIDADGSHDPIDIPLLVKPIKEGLADQVVGSRLLGGSDELHGGGDEFLRLAGSAFITYVINRRFCVRLSDSQNGLRAIRAQVFRCLDTRSRHTTIEMEMIMNCLARGFRVAEVPTHELPRAAGYSKISLMRPSTWCSYGFCLVRGLLQRRRTA